MRQLPSLTALRAFEAAGRLGRITGAAEELGVTHGAVSRQVSQLEAWLGLRLFSGPRSRPALTAAGERLLAGLSPAFDRLEAAVREVSGGGDGPLTLSCPGTFTTRWLVPRLYRFTNRHPDVELRLAAARAGMPMQQLRFDVAVKVLAPPYPLDLLAVPFIEEFVGPVLAPDLAGDVPFRDVVELASLPLLRADTRPEAWQEWLGLLGRTDLDATGSQRFDHAYYMLEAAVVGLGVCIAPWPLVTDDIRAGRLVAPFGFMPSGRHYVALRPSRRGSAGAAFVEWLRAEGAKTFPPDGFRPQDRAAPAA